MTMTELLEEKREQLTRQIETAGTPDRARAVVETALDRLLYRYNESCDDDSCREAASQMLRAVRTAVPLLDSVGEIRVWERDAPADAKRRRSGRKRESGKGQLLSFILLILGIALAAAALAVSLAGKPDLSRLTNAPLVLVFLTGALLSLYFSGLLRGSTLKRALKQRMTECVVDADGIYRKLHAVTLVIDQELMQVEAATRWEKRAADAGVAESLSEDDLAVYAGLLEAACSGDSAYAFEKLNELRCYLHTKHVDVVDYSDEHAAWFDRMPSAEKGTLRPALVSDGKLLRKGMVSGGI